MKYKEVSVLRYEIGGGEMRKEGTWIKNHPRRHWDLRKREGEERKMIKCPGMTSYLPPRRIQLSQGPNTIILSHTGFGTSTERYDNFRK